MNGVKKYKVNLATEKATVEFDPEKTGVKQIIESIKATGYGAEEAESEDYQKEAGEKEIDKNTIMDFDASGNLIGIELLFVRERNPTLLKELKFENLVSA